MWLIPPPNQLIPPPHRLIPLPNRLIPPPNRFIPPPNRRFSNIRNIRISRIFEYFDDWTRSFIVKLNHGGHYPYHRDHCRINRETIRLIVFFGDSNGGLDWEVDGKNMSWYPNRMYYVNTIKRHRLSAWQKNCAMGVFTVRKNWSNVTKIMSRYL